MYRRGPVIAHCTDWEDFPLPLIIKDFIMAVFTVTLNSMINEFATLW